MHRYELPFKQQRKGVIPLYIFEEDEGDPELEERLGLPIEGQTPDDEDTDQSIIIYTWGDISK